MIKHIVKNTYIILPDDDFERNSKYYSLNCIRLFNSCFKVLTFWSMLYCLLLSLNRRHLIVYTSIFEVFHTVHVTIFLYLFFILLKRFFDTSQDVFMVFGKSCQEKERERERAICLNFIPFQAHA